MLNTRKQWQLTPTENWVLSTILHWWCLLYNRRDVWERLNEFFRAYLWQNWHWLGLPSCFSVHSTGIVTQCWSLEPAPLVHCPITVAGEEAAAQGRIPASAFHWCCVTPVVLTNHLASELPGASFTSPYGSTLSMSTSLWKQTNNIHLGGKVGSFQHNVKV